MVKHTRKIDSVLRFIYKAAIRNLFFPYIPMKNSIPITLVALGSYGREQLCVHSDIDLMIVYRNVDGYALKPMMEKIIQIAWDSGLKLGSRVHEVGELFDVSNTDITIKTALLESRLIVGSKSLWHESEKELEKIRKFAQDEYIAKKIEELNLRHAKYPISMTFNIKESQGGLRDTNTIYWLLNIKYGATKIKDMIGVVFSDEEYKSYRIAMEYLFRVRNAIHLSSSKKTDTLQLEYLPQVAELMGEKPKHSNSKEMVLATKIISYQVEIYTLTMIFINRILGKLAITIKSFREVLDSEQTCIDFALVDALKNFDIAKRDKDLAKYFKSIFSKENSPYLL
ncbi:MAG: phosphohydrolase, partial [Epsilonproteobacteria bacterium]|nr:phosphohydrolase [Campylobacterota bacterium]